MHFDALAHGRAAAERRMVDTCLIRRRTGLPVVDLVTAKITVPRTTIYEGKCRIQQTNAQAAEQDAGQAFLLMVRLELHVPIAVVGIEAEDEVTIISSRDPDLIGRELTVRDLFHKTDATARRIGVVERTS